MPGSQTKTGHMSRPRNTPTPCTARLRTACCCSRWRWTVPLRRSQKHSEHKWFRGSIPTPAGSIPGFWLNYREFRSKHQLKRPQACCERLLLLSTRQQTEALKAEFGPTPMGSRPVTKQGNADQIMVSRDSFHGHEASVRVTTCRNKKCSAPVQNVFEMTMVKGPDNNGTWQSRLAALQVTFPSPGLCVRGGKAVSQTAVVHVAPWQHSCG